MPSEPTKATSALSLDRLARLRGYVIEESKFRKGSYYLWKGTVAAKNPDGLPFFTEAEAREFLVDQPVVE